MASQDTRALVRDLYGAYERGDFACVSDMLHDDIDWMIYAPVGLFPFAGHRTGRAAVLETLGAIGAQYQLDRYTPQIIVVDGDRAAVMSDVHFCAAFEWAHLALPPRQFPALARRQNHRVSGIRQHFRRRRTGAGPVSGRVNAPVTSACGSRK